MFKYKQNKKFTSKGDRLNWMPIKKVSGVNLTNKLTIGKRLTKQLSLNNQNTFLIP